MRIAQQQNREIIKPRHNALKLYAIHKEHCYRDFLLTNIVQEDVLDILGFFGAHYGIPSCFWAIAKETKTLSAPAHRHCHTHEAYM
jgi:hypothetical protein